MKGLHDGGRPWSPEDRVELVRLRGEGGEASRWELLARKFERTVSACKSIYYGHYHGGRGQSQTQDRRQARTRVSLARGDESTLLWSDARILKLGELLAAGATFEQIAEACGVTPEQVKQKVTFGLSERVRRLIHSGGGTMRKCLCCRCEFLSEGNGNRLCSLCRGVAANASPLALHEGSGGHRVRSVDVHIGNGRPRGEF